MDWSGIKFTADWQKETKEAQRRIDKHNKDKAWSDLFWETAGGAVGFAIGGPAGMQVGKTLGSMQSTLTTGDIDFDDLKFNQGQLSDINKNINTGATAELTSDVMSLATAWAGSEAGTETLSSIFGSEGLMYSEDPSSSFSGFDINQYLPYQSGTSNQYYNTNTSLFNPYG
tara:strand:- start:538 stop:1050 length:513 start_codon:yes stop_codon:yes gene_type:complete